MMVAKIIRGASGLCRGTAVSGADVSHTSPVSADQAGRLVSLSATDSAALDLN